MYKLHESRHDILIAAQTVEKPLDYLKMGSQGRSPRTGRQPFVPLHRAVALCG